MKIFHLGIRDKFYKFIESLYLSSIYNIINNSNRNNFANNSSSIDSENRNINISDSENNNIITPQPPQGNDQQQAPQPPQGNDQQQAPPQPPQGNIQQQAPPAGDNCASIWGQCGG